MKAPLISRVSKEVWGLNMKLFWKVSFLIFICVGLAIAQPYSKCVLLEATVTGAGMVQLEGKHLYVRLYDDGEVEYKDQIVKKGMPTYVIRRAKLSKAELQQIQEFLQSASVETLEPNYPSLSPALDHVLELSISLMDQKASKTIVVTNFYPTSPKAAKSYPPSLIELMCKIEHLRKDSAISIMANTKEWCDK